MPGRIFLTIVGGALLAVASVQAADPKPKAAAKQVQPEPSPAPRELQLEIFPPPAFPVYERVSKYAVWQMYGVDRRGFFRPLVVNSPYGAYYRYNGAPYPWMPVNQLEVMPYVVD